MPVTGQAFPSRLKHYDLQRIIGQGAMGMVIEGVDRRDGTRVAVKLLHASLAASDATYLDRFEREAHVAALLRSPYTVHLVDYGVEAGEYFLVMEFVEGQTLAQRLAHGPLPADEALRIGGEIARALEEAGARGIVHRDIKPENVLLDANHRVKVTDFGIARSISASGLTLAGGFIGTPAFAAPEQMDGPVDQRSDVYALGATLYAALTGNPPFTGRTAMETLMMHRSAPVPSGPLAHLPDAIQNVIRRCLEKDPLDRYQNATELAGAIDRGRQVLARSSAGGASPPPLPRPPQASPSLRPAASPPQPGPGSTRVYEAPPPARPSLSPPRQPTGPVVQHTGGLPPGWAMASAPAPAPQPPARPPKRPSWRSPVLGLAALGIAVGAAAFGAVVLLAPDDDDDDGRATPTSEPTGEPTAAVTVTATTPAVTAETPATTAGAGLTATPVGGWTRINEIRLRDGVYQVTFETNGFTYGLPGEHVHFFFDTVPEEQAGEPGPGPWILYGGSSPFTGYTEADRRAGAEQLCVVVANPDHTIRPGTGNCVDLP